MSADAEMAQLLAALCSGEAAVRKGGEAALAGSRRLGGFAPRLAAAATAPDASAGTLPLPLRQMALTVLRQLVNDHWTDLGMDDQLQVQQRLLGALAAESTVLRGLLHAAAVAVRLKGGPWPALVEQLGAGLVQGTAHEAVCCVETVAALLDEGGLEVATSLGVLQAPMLQHASAEASPPELRRRCVEAHAAGVTTFVACRGAGEGALAAALAALPPWLAAHAALCTGCDGWSDRDRVACAFTAVRTVTSLCRFGPVRDALLPGLEPVLRPACLLVQQLEASYNQAVVESDDNGSADEEEAGPAQLVAQLMELIQAMMIAASTRVLLKGKVQSLLQLLVPFMRVTEAQCRTWREDPNEFLAHEEDERVCGAAVRLSGEYMLGEFLEHMKRETGKALPVLIKELLDRGDAGRSGGDVRAWKLSELALLLFGVAAGGSTVKALQRSDFGPLLPTVLTASARLCGDKVAQELLRARAFALLRRLGDAVCAMAPAELPALLEASACGLAPDEPMVVRVSACRAFCRFLTAVSDKALRDRVLVERGVLSSLGSLVRAADEELLHLTLESLCIIVRHSVDTIVTVAGELSGLISEIWQRSRADPLVSLQVLDLVSCASAGDQRLQVSMEGVLMPTIARDLQPGADPHAASSAVQLYDVLLRRAAVPFAGLLWETVPPLIELVMRAEESGFLESACDVLVSLVRRSPAQVTEAGLLVPMLRCVERLLGPGLEDNACCFVGPFLALLLQKFGQDFPPSVVEGLLRAVVSRLATAKLPYLLQELLVVVARLMHQDLAGVLSVLAAAPAPAAAAGAAGGSGNCFEVLLSVWLANAEQVRAKRARAVTITALCRLYERCSEDAQLQVLRIGVASTAPLPERLLGVIVAALEFDNERTRRSREHQKSSRLDSDEDDDDEVGDGEDGEDDGIGGRAAQRRLLELLEEDDSDDEDLDELLHGDGGGGAGGDAYADLERDDPFNSLDLRATAVEFLTQLKQRPADEALVTRIAAAVGEARAAGPG